MLLDSKKIILIVAVLLVIGFFIIYRKKNSSTTTTDATDTANNSVANNILSSVTDAVSSVELSEEDEEYNLLRQEYSDRYGQAAKQSWSKAMIQQKIDEYDERSSLLNQLVSLSGNDAYEEAKNLNADDIQRLIETEKQRKAQEYEDAKNNYKAATGKAPDSSLDTVQKLSEAAATEYTLALDEYQAAYGVRPTNLYTALQVRQALSEHLQEDANNWASRRNYLQSFGQSLMSGLDGRGTTGNKRWLMNNLFPELLAMNDRDFVYTCDFCANAYSGRGLDFYGGGVMYDIVNHPIIYFRENANFVTSIVERRNQLSSYNWNKINQYGYFA